MQPLRYAFFGTGPLAESVLATLYRNGYIPSLVVTKPDKEQGRHMVVTAPSIKTWASLKGIDVFQPESLKDLREDSVIFKQPFDVFIVASYGKIIPESILTLPEHGVLNVHPSLLPKYRGPSPLESALLNGDMSIGVSIMKLDNEMDHGPILVQNSFMTPTEATAGTLEVICGQMGGEMLVQCLSHYIEKTLLPQEQNHAEATICKKITKELGLIHLHDDIREVRRKYRALSPWPGLYFFITHKDKEIRVKINALDLVTTKNEITADAYILSVTPEGKKQMDFESFKRGYMNSN
ncbi:MAG: hypothetical protein RI935_29 [Candidatus Parcubacteria bacterium]|jgi:methionyl-tRNA formyltransferase